MRIKENEKKFKEGEGREINRIWKRIKEREDKLWS